MAKKEIFVVEDEVIIGMEIQERLKDLGYRVAGMAASGAEAVTKVVDTQPDLVLMDIMLKGRMDGIAAAQQIRTVLDIPVIYLTAYADDNTLERAKLTEPFGYLVKPFEERELHTTIEMAFYKHRTEKKLKESEQWLNTLLKSIGDAVIATDKKGCITFMNPVAERITHWQQADALGQELSRIFCLIDKETGNPVKSPVVTVLQEEMTVNLNDSVILSKDEFHKPIDASAAPIKDDDGRITGIVLVFRDITERKETEIAIQSSVQQMKTAYEQATIYAHQLKEEIIERKQIQETLQENQARLDGIISTARDAIITINAEQRIILFNTAAERMFGYKAPEVMGRPLKLLLPERFRQVHPQQVDQFIRTGVTARAMGMPNKLWGQRVDGEEFPIEAMISKVEISGQVLCTTIIRDITERKQLEERLKAIYRLGQELPLVRDEISIIHRVLSTAIYVLDFEVACCGLVNETMDQLTYHFHSTVSRPEEGHLYLPLSAEQSVGVAVVHRGQALNIPDVNKDPRYIPLPGTPPIRSELCVPMKVAQRIIGVLNVESTKANRFTPGDQQLLQALANRTAVALENARLHAETERRAKELNVLNLAGRAMTSTLNLDAVLAQMMVEVKKILEAEDASVLLLDSDNEDLFFAAQADSTTAETLIGRRVPLANSLAGWAVQTREPILIDDVQNDPRFYNQIDTVTGMTTHSLLAVPLVYQNEVIGVVEVINKAGEAFNQHDLELLESLSRSATIAIENARLHTETKQHAQQLAVLRELDQAITASLQIDDVYHAFARHAARLLIYDRMSIALLEEEGVYVTYVDAYKESKPAAGMTLPREDSAVGWVASQGQPLVRHNIANDLRFSEDQHLVDTGILSSMSIPLRIKRRVIGTWNIGSRKIGAYGPRDLNVAQSMADQLAVAIENARLYKKEREQFRRLQESQAQLVQVEKMAALGRLVASIAHEINNPLQAIQNCFVLIEEELEDLRRPDKLNIYTGVAKSEIGRISTIVRRMRDFYRPTQQGPQAPLPDAASLDHFYHLSSEELQMTDLHAILENVLQLAGKQLQHSGIQVESTWSKDLPNIEASPDHLKQVFLNLVLNAIDAMATQGGGQLYLLTEPEQISSNNGNPQPFARIKFRDTGKGMSPEVLSRLFEPLFTTKESGSGFGLFTSYKIVEAHHGRITAQSRPGKGTTFTILLPVKQP